MGPRAAVVTYIHHTQYQQLQVVYLIYNAYSYDRNLWVPILITPDFQVYTDTMERLTKEAYTDPWYEYISDLLDSAV